MLMAAKPSLLIRDHIRPAFKVKVDIILVGVSPELVHEHTDYAIPQRPSQLMCESQLPLLSVR